MVKKMIRCAACNRVIPNYEGYELAQAQNLAGVEWSNEDLVHAKEFLLTHFGHSLEELIVERDSLISTKPSLEPMGATYFLAGNAERKFLIKRTRIALDRPAFYEIIPGRLKITNVSVKIQEDDLRKQIAAEKEFSLLLKRKMQKFIEAFREEMAGLSPEEFEEETERIEEGETSLGVYGSLKESRWVKILDRCRRNFKEVELKAIRRFIDENRNPPDVLSLQIQRRLSVISLAEGESEVALQERKEAEGVLEVQSREVEERKAAK